MKPLSSARRVIFLCIAIGSAGINAQAEAVSARAVVEKNTVYVGESFLFQVNIDGDESPSEPDTSEIVDFTIEPLGGRRNSSNSVTIINGQMTRNVRRAYIFSYRLTPKREGNLVIPALDVAAAGENLRTQPVRILATKPKKSRDFALKMRLSANEVYVGQPVILTVTWYIGKDVEDFSFQLPVLNDQRFDFYDPELKIDRTKARDYLEVPLGGENVIAKKGRRVRQGKEFVTVSFKKVLIPKKAGSIDIPGGTVNCNAVTGYRARRYQDPLDSFFNDDFVFGRRKQAVYEKFVVPSNDLPLVVKELPSENRPAGFSGLVGHYSVSTQAQPTSVRVGDPITLNIEISGPEYLDNVNPPLLSAQPDFVEKFKIPQDMAPGKIAGNTITFTQTLRAKHADVTEVPAVLLPYFDVKKGAYAVAKSAPIPLQVAATRVVTAGDAEGVVRNMQTKSELETWSAGIQYNYDDPSVLRNEALGRNTLLSSPLRMAVLIVPPFVYVVLLFSVTVIRRRRADPNAIEARGAFAKFNKSINEIRCQQPKAEPEKVYQGLLDALRQYFGSRFQLSARALTYKDIEALLQQSAISEPLCVQLREIFTTCEASRYAGASAALAEDIEELFLRSVNIIKQVEDRAK